MKSLYEIRLISKSENPSDALSELSIYLKSFPNDVDAWLLMAELVETKDQKLFCYRRVLKIDLDNQIAQDGIRALVTIDNHKVAEPKERPPKTETIHPEPTITSSVKPYTKTDDSKTLATLSQIGTYLAVGIVVVLLVAAIASPEYGSTVCGGILLVGVGFGIWLWVSSNAQRGETVSKAIQEQKQVSYNPPIGSDVSPHVIQSSSNIVTCRSCGNPVARTAPVCPNCGDAYPGLIAKCPSCGSNRIRITPKGFSLGKAATGAIIAGPIGIAGGLHGRKDLSVICSNCHNSFTIKNSEI